MQVPPSGLPACLPYIRQALSNPRLDAYRAQPNEDELDLLARYAWNMALGSSLYGPLHLLEVALRNTLHRAVSRHHGGNDRWYQLAQAFPDSDSREQARQAEARVARMVNPAHPDAPGRVVAQLSFGFWTSLLSSNYGRPRSKGRNWVPLWPALVPIAFPGLRNPTGTKRDRQMLAERFDKIRQLRNRISHHEPIWRGRPDPRSQGRVRLDRQYDELVEALSWISPEVLHAAPVLSTFAQVYVPGPSPYRQVLQGLP